MIELVNVLLKLFADIITITLKFLGKLFKTDILLTIFVVVMFFVGIAYNFGGIFWLCLLVLLIIVGVAAYNGEELNTLDDYLMVIDRIRDFWANNRQETDFRAGTQPINSSNIVPPPIQPNHPMQPVEPIPPIQPPNIEGVEPPLYTPQRPIYTQPPQPPQPPIYQPPRPTTPGFKINRKSPNLSSKGREKDTILDLKELLETNIKSQDTAIKGVIDGLKRAAVISERRKTTLNFLMTGPTGTGKTEMVKLVAQGLRKPFVRYDMGSYKDKEQLWQLLGSPQGYIGGEGKLTQFIKSNPTACILFDEIEKGADEIFDFMLPMLDEGIVKDNRSDQTVDFSKTMVFFTTNLVTDTPEEAKENPEIVRDLILNKRFLRQEFIARIKNIVPFFEFSEEDIGDIVSIQLETYIKHVVDPKNEHIPITCDEDVIDFITSKVDRKYGARNIAQNIERYVGNSLTDQLFHRGQKRVNSARFWVENEAIKVEVQ